MNDAATRGCQLWIRARKLRSVRTLPQYGRGGAAVARPSRSCGCRDEADCEAATAPPGWTTVKVSLDDKLMSFAANVRTKSVEPNKPAYHYRLGLLDGLNGTSQRLHT